MDLHTATVTPDLLDNTEILLVAAPYSPESMWSGFGLRMTTPSSTEDSAMYFDVASSARSPVFSSTGV